ncbi:ash family protein [Escherichia coli]|uniref:ash family protein n=1 Tax=Escherichia coli TaxID=562 RepID=UPI003D9ABAE5
MRKLIGQQIGEAMTLTLTEGQSGNCLAESHPDVNHNMHPLHKKGLPFVPNQVYGYMAPAKSGVGIGVPVNRMATCDAPSVFFYVVGLTHPFFGRWCIIQRLSRAMVAQAGASSEAPVFIRAGYANPVWATTSEIGVSGGSVTRYRMETATCWLLPLPKIRNLSGLSPQFVAIVRQSNLFSTMLLLRLSVMLVALWCVITSVSLLAASSCRGCAMIKIYDLPIDPKERSANLISLALLMDEVLKGNADNRDEYLSALISLFEVYARDLHSLLEGHALPEVSQ